MASNSQTTQITQQPTDALFQRYNQLSVDDKLALLYYVYEAMGDRIVGMPKDYNPEGPVQEILADLKGMEFESQISLLREAASRMGFTSVTAPPPLAETGVTNSL